MKKGITVDNVSFEYERNKKIIQNISFIIKPGAFLGIAGVNGSGKTTLTYLFNGLIPHFIKGHLTGKVMIDDTDTSSKNVSYFARKVGMVFQNPDFSLFNLTVSEELGFGLKNFGIKNRAEKIKKALEYVDLENFSDRDPQTLSFGEKQKISLACVLTLDTDYIVLDEPSAMLDFTSSVYIYNILKKLNNKNKTIIIVEHDTDFLWQYTNEVLIIDKGEIKAYGPTKKILSETKTIHKIGLKPPNTTSLNK